VTSTPPSTVAGKIDQEVAVGGGATIHLSVAPRTRWNRTRPGVRASGTGSRGRGGACQTERRLTGTGCRAYQKAIGGSGPGAGIARVVAQ
jgi:hypothetical protein